MPKKPQPTTLTTWVIYKIAAFGLAFVRGPAVENAAEEFKADCGAFNFAPRPSVGGFCRCCARSRTLWDRRLFGRCAAIKPQLHVRGDRELLIQAFANLVENAIRHSGKGSSICVTAAMNVEFSVGTGMQNPSFGRPALIA